jgi:hypothetical protein
MNSHRTFEKGTDSILFGSRHCTLTAGIQRGFRGTGRSCSMIPIVEKLAVLVTSKDAEICQGLAAAAAETDCFGLVIMTHEVEVAMGIIMTNGCHGPTVPQVDVVVSDYDLPSPYLQARKAGTSITSETRWPFVAQLVHLGEIVSAAIVTEKGFTLLASMPNTTPGLIDVFKSIANAAVQNYP